MTGLVTGFPDALDRSLLHVFVFGPGEGEAVLVAFPRRGWLLVDGCHVNVDGKEQFPALEIFEALRSDDDDGLEGLVWSHPHLDHFAGLIEAMDRHHPRKVGLAFVEHPEPGSAARELEALGTHPLLPADTRLADAFNLLRSTFERVFAYWREQPASCWPVSEAAPPLVSGETTVKAYSPACSDLEQFYRTPALATRLRAQANEYSIVLGVRHRQAHLLLGGDLPDRVHGQELLHGWARIEASVADVAGHQGAKIPHHGSAEAIRQTVFVPSSRERAWLVTPFAKKRLPKPTSDESGGLRVLLGANRSVCLTASSGLLREPPRGRPVPVSQLEAALASAGALSAGLSVESPARATDCGWGFSVDDQGEVRAWYAGNRALTVVAG